MLQLRELNLEFAFARAGALRENVENQRGPIQNFATESQFKITTLSGRKFVVKNHGVDAIAFAVLREFSGFASADKRAGDGGFELLRAFSDDFGARGGGEFP